MVSSYHILMNPTKRLYDTIRKPIQGISNSALTNYAKFLQIMNEYTKCATEHINEISLYILNCSLVLKQ